MGKYKSIHEVPLRWRRIGHTPLALEQVNQIVQSAEKSDDEFAVALGRERAAFAASHEVSGGHFVKRKPQGGKQS